MGDGGSQSPITMRLNLLASGRMRSGELRTQIANRLRDTPSIVDLVTSAIDGTTIATNERERDHITRWPNSQLELVRSIVQTAISQTTDRQPNGRPTFYDWQFENAEPGITIRDNGEGVFITFRSRPEL